MLNLKQISNEGVTLSLLNDTCTSIHKDNREVSSRSSRNHVTSVLNVTWGISDDELSVRSREVAVRYINCNSLLTFGFEAVCKKGEVDVFVTFFLRTGFYGFELILEDTLGIIEKAPNEG